MRDDSDKLTTVTVREHLAGLGVLEFNPVALTMNPEQGITYKKKQLSGQAYLDLCNVFRFRRDGLSASSGQGAKTADQKEDLTESWHGLARAIQKFRQMPRLEAVVDESTQFVERILKVSERHGDKNPLDFDTQIEFLGAYEAENQGVELEQVRFDIRKMAVTAMAIDKSSEIKVARQDDWHIGVGFNLAQGNGWFSPAFWRIICTNGMMAVHRAQKQWLVGLQALSKTRLRLRAANRLEDMVINNTRRMMASHASLGEMEKVRDQVDSEVFDRKFRVAQIQRAYVRAGVAELRDSTLFGMPGHWLDAADSGVRAYDLFNYCTDVASHDESINDAQRVHLNRVAGDFFFDGPRLASQPPNPFLGH